MMFQEKQIEFKNIDVNQRQSTVLKTKGGKTTTRTGVLSTTQVNGGSESNRDGKSQRIVGGTSKSL